MNKFLLFTSLFCITFLCSCGFLLSPIGEELIVDGAEEVIKIEKELTHPKTTNPPSKESDKEPVKAIPNEPIKETIKGIYKEAK